MNNVMTREITDAEIKDVVFAIKSSSVPGKDGMSGLFFQQYWSIIGKEITQEVKGFFSDMSNPKDP